MLVDYDISQRASTFALKAVSICLVQYDRYYNNTVLEYSQPLAILQPILTFGSPKSTNFCPLLLALIT